MIFLRFYANRNDDPPYTLRLSLQEIAIAWQSCNETILMGNIELKFKQKIKTRFESHGTLAGVYEREEPP